MRSSLLVIIALFGCACGNVHPAPQPALIDTLDFVIGASTTWPREGSQAQHQLVDVSQQQVCWVKYADLQAFECWTWDDTWVRHLVDQAIDGDHGESYRFTDGRWLPRHMATSWTLNIENNVIHWFDRECRLQPLGSHQGMPGTGLFPYSLRAEVHPNQFVSADLGVRDVLVLDYGPHASGQASGTVERFSFARGAGWYRWDSARGSATFDHMGGQVVTRGQMCGEPW